MTRYLFDTNIMSALADDPRGPINRRIRQVGLSAVCTSFIVAGELRFGMLRKASRILDASMSALLEMIVIEPLKSPIDQRYGEVRAYLQARGQLIGPNDTWIAAHALALDCTLVTANTGEFSRVPSLRVENWLAD